MVRRRLTGIEREIRQSRGIPLASLLPFVFLIGVIVVIVLDQPFMQQCLFDMSGGARRDMIGKMILALANVPMIGWFAAATACGPRYLSDFSHHLLVIAIFWLSAISAVNSFFWLKRHAAYWDAVRQKERADRAAKSKKAAEDGIGSE